MKRRKTLRHYKNTDKDYGTRTQMPDMDPQLFKDQQNHILKGLEENLRNRIVMEQSTKSQSANSEWKRVRTFMLIASKYGLVIRRGITTEYAPLVKQVFYPSFLTKNKAMSYGKEHEAVAIKELEVFVKKNISNE